MEVSQAANLWLEYIEQIYKKIRVKLLKKKRGYQ